MTDLDPLWIESLKEYEIVEAISVSCSIETVKAIHNKTNKAVVIKLYKNFMQDPVKVRRILRMISAHRKLSSLESN